MGSPWSFFCSALGFGCWIIFLSPPSMYPPIFRKCQYLLFTFGNSSRLQALVVLNSPCSPVFLPQSFRPRYPRSSEGNLEFFLFVVLFVLVVPNCIHRQTNFRPTSSSPVSVGLLFLPPRSPHSVMLATTRPNPNLPQKL